MSESPTLTETLAAEQRASWDRNGYLVLDGFVSDAEIESIQALYRKVWEECPHEIVVDNLETGRRTRMDQLTEDERDALFYKVNDLYLAYEEVRRLVLGERLAPILAELLGDAPVLCNSLNLLRSSQQDDHVDSIFMTPRTPHKLVATWIALEDSHPDAGMLRYFPGSHKIPLFTFSNGTHHVDRDQMEEFDEYIHSQIEERGIEPELFPAKKGDLLIWHGDLVHGGSKVNNRELTRDSLVSHYWSLEDSRAKKMKLEPLNAGYWWKRPPQEVPGETSFSPKALAKSLVPAPLKRAIMRRRVQG